MMRYYRKVADTTHYQQAAHNRTWRMRPDPFAQVWNEIEWELREKPNVQSKVMMQRLQQRHPGQFPDKQSRTLQRRVRDWRLQQMKESVEVIVPNLEELFVLPLQNQAEPRALTSNIST